jgi:hypothetical protein
VDRAQFHAAAANGGDALRPWSLFERLLTGSYFDVLNVRLWPTRLIPSGLAPVDDSGIDCYHADQASLRRCQKLVLRPWAIRNDRS